MQPVRFVRSMTPEKARWNRIVFKQLKIGDVHQPLRYCSVKPINPAL